MKLSLGTIGGRAIALAALPLVTRIYSPEHFTLLAVYLAIVGTISVAACLRLEVAIPVAESDYDAANLLALALTALAGICTLILLSVLVMPVQIATWIGQLELIPYLPLIPIGIAFAGTYSTLRYWATRKRRFTSIALTRLSQAGTGVLLMISFGSIGMAPLGLLLGNMFNIGAGWLSLGIQTLRNDKSTLQSISVNRALNVIKEYYKYPIYSTPESLLNVAGAQLPILLIAAHAGAEAGYLFLALQLMAAPMKLLGGSISQVYISRSRQAFHEGRLASITLKLAFRLATIGVFPIVVVGVLSPYVVPKIFGSEWARSGEIVLLLVPWMALQFIASPISTVMFIVGKQRVLLALTTFGAVLRIGSVIVGTLCSMSLVLCFSIASALFYAICIIIFLQSSLSPFGNDKEI